MTLGTFAAAFLGLCLGIGAATLTLHADGAGMDRNMPRGDPASAQLNLQEAWGVAAFLQAQPRPRYRPAP